MINNNSHYEHIILIKLPLISSGPGALALLPPGPLAEHRRPGPLYIYIYIYIYTYIYIYRERDIDR